MKITEKLREFLFSDNNETLLRNIVILGLMGIVLLFAGTIIPDGERTPEPASPDEESGGEHQMTNRQPEEDDYVSEL
ncbi:MAG: hypothetical protein ACOC5A_04605, partial [Halanaerobiales bacterium]